MSGALSQAELDSIYQTLLDRLVIFFPGQEIGAEAQLNFAKTFGELDKPHMIYPHAEGFREVTLIESDGGRPTDTNVWHTDLTYYPEPPFASVLHARVLPESGGDTLWASMYAAYDKLPETIKEEIDQLEAIHDPGTFRNQFLGPDKDIGALNKAMASVGSALHPVVKTHPGTGRKYLYVNSGFTCQIYGYSTAESDRLLSYLYSHINQPEFQLRHRWAVGDVAMWDNRVTQHYAVADYGSHYRCMHRVTVVRDMRVT